LRSADAAASTGELIEESIKNSDSGVLLNQEVLSNLGLINDGINKASRYAPGRKQLMPSKRTLYGRRLRLKIALCNNSKQENFNIQ
jgi:hypothetical protein